MADAGSDLLAGSGLPELVAGRSVLVVGAGVAGLAVIRLLAAAGADVAVAADRPVTAPLPAGVRLLGAVTTPPPATDLVVTSPGVPPHDGLLTACAAAGVEVIGEVELAWRMDQARPAGPRPWLVVTGTNGKTTTTGMLEAMLRAAGLTVTACGNIGASAAEAVADPTQQVIAAELSSFQLHGAPSLRPRAGVVLNLAEDHLDWHGSMAAYGAAKARVLTGDVAVAVVDDAAAAAMLDDAPAGRRVGVTGGVPGPGQLGVQRIVPGSAEWVEWVECAASRDNGGENPADGPLNEVGGPGFLVDRAFGTGVLGSVGLVRPPGRHNVTNALAAAALTLALPVDDPAAVAGGLAAYAPGGHRNEPVGTVAGVVYVDDSKATNPHAAAASLTTYPSVVWVAGGQLKGASVDELVLEIRDRLRAVVLLGVDAPIIERALSRHAPDVPRRSVLADDDGSVDAVAVMDSVVRAAAGYARPGDVVLLAPAAASRDMFVSYAERGHAFAAAVAGLPGERAEGAR